MKIHVNGQKIYICNKCYAEVYSLICRIIDGEWIEVCSQCYDEEVGKNDISRIV